MSVRRQHIPEPAQVVEALAGGLTTHAGQLANLPIVTQTGLQLGWPAGTARELGVILAVCTVLYAYPRTAILGAILLTGYLGGAVATHLRVGNPVFSHTLFGVYIGVMAWAGLWLRDPRLRALLPFSPS